ncbi:MAG: hypothetical protein JRG86_09825 [Deltaproteobacteria bacterium]|jgi:polyhydroxyalkanoate synthesis repressor PhaR|nr:hypothetical protein [Deltaproteobacteria bacterium]MBW2500965.1 hypothetical protein [Deltaproteobacteria bacterium]
MAILIKRYANRKLYNTESSRYITLKGIAQLLEEGEEVRVMDNETGEDITQVTLSQILVDSERAREDPSDTLLSQILSRGGDALYTAIRKSVDDATEGLGDFQDRLRRLVNQSEPFTRPGRGFGWDGADRDPASGGERPSRARESAGRSNADPHGHRRSTARMEPELGEIEAVIRKTVAETIESCELPHRDDIARLTRNLERVAVAVERLESAYRTPRDPEASD